MEVHQAIVERRSVRNFSDKPIETEVLDRVLNAARWAPSWANTQAVRWIMITDPAMKLEAVVALSPGNPSAKAMTTAPVVLALCYVKRRSGFYKGQNTTSLGDWGFFDAGLASANLTLAAVSEGLGTVHVGATNVDLAANILGLPEEWQFVEFIPLGYPEKKPQPTHRLELSEIVYRDRYEERK